MALDVRTQVRMTREDLEELKERAEENGFTMSDYIRYLIKQDKGGDE